MNLQARGASRKKTRTHVYKHTRAEKEAHKTHHAFLWSLFDPFTLTKLYLHLIGKENINTWQWKRSNKMDSEEWEKKNDTHSFTYSHINVIIKQFIFPLWLERRAFDLWLKTKWIALVSCLFFACHQKDLAYFMISPTVNQWLLLRGGKNWVLDRLIKHAKQKKTYAHTSSRDTTRVREWKKKKKMEMLMLR